MYRSLEKGMMQCTIYIKLYYIILYYIWNASDFTYCIFRVKRNKKRKFEQIGKDDSDSDADDEAEDDENEKSRKRQKTGAQSKVNTGKKRSSKRQMDSDTDDNEEEEEKAQESKKTPGFIVRILYSIYF